MLPASKIKDRLELDTERSWIVILEANEFIWPGPDLRPCSGKGLETLAYGFLPSRLFATVLARFRAIAREGKARRTK
jgi:hypothetical protein